MPVRRAVERARRRRAGDAPASSASVDAAVHGVVEARRSREAPPLPPRLSEPPHDAARARRAAAGVDRVDAGAISATCRCTRRGATAASRSRDLAEGGPCARMDADRRHRSFVRPADRARHEHGAPRCSSTRRSTRSTSGSRDASASTRASRRTSSPTARSICRRTSAGSSSTSSRRRTRSCARTPIRPRGCSPRSGCPASRSSGHPQGRMYNTPAGHRGRLAQGVPRGGEARRRDRDRRQLASAGHRLRAGGDRDGGGLPLRARQRRAQHRGVPVHRLRHRPRAHRRRSPPTASSIAGKSRSSTRGCARDSAAASYGLRDHEHETRRHERFRSCECSQLERLTQRRRHRRDDSKTPRLRSCRLSSQAAGPYVPLQSSLCVSVTSVSLC